jgi:hypothetical protein
LVADIECDIRFDKDAVHLTIPRRTNYSRFAGHLQKTATDPLCVGFYPREKSASFTSMDALPKSTADRKALIEKLQLDRMVEERREVCGEV